MEFFAVNKFHGLCFSLSWCTSWLLEGITHLSLSGPYPLNEIVFEKMGSLDIEMENYRSENLVILDFAPITAHDPSHKRTDSTTLIGTHVLISISIHSSLFSEAIFVCDINPRCLSSNFLLPLLTLSKRSSMELRQCFHSNIQQIEQMK